MCSAAIVFDFDGVIANSEPLHFRAFRDVLAERGVELSEPAYYTRYLGFDDLGAFRAIRDQDRGRTWSAGELTSLTADKAMRMEALERDASVLFPGAADAIRRAAAAVPIAIASGALGVEIGRVLDGANLTHHFRAIVAAEDTAAGKPAPDPYQRAVALLSASIGDAVLAADCVAIEDSRWGIASARAAGLRAVGVTSSYDAAELSQADLIIESLAELDITGLQRLLC